MIAKVRGEPPLPRNEVGRSRQDPGEFERPSSHQPRGSDDVWAWCATFNCSASDLLDAVNEVGPIASRVYRFLSHRLREAPIPLDAPFLRRRRQTISPGQVKRFGSVWHEPLGGFSPSAQTRHLRSENSGDVSSRAASPCRNRTASIPTGSPIFSERPLPGSILLKSRDVIAAQEWIGSASDARSSSVPSRSFIRLTLHAVCALNQREHRVGLHGAHIDSRGGSLSAHCGGREVHLPSKGKRREETWCPVPLRGQLIAPHRPTVVFRASDRSRQPSRSKQRRIRR